MDQRSENLETRDSESLVFINTDATSLGGASPHDRWIEYGKAFTGGDRRFAAKLARLNVGCTLLMWANGLGVVAVGRVAAAWDGKTHTQPQIYKAPFYDVEYRISVDWYLDLRDAPIGSAELGFNPRQSVENVIDDVRRRRLLELVTSRSEAASSSPGR